MSVITFLYLQNNCGMTFIVPLVAKITLEGNFVENPFFFCVRYYDNCMLSSKILFDS